MLPLFFGVQSSPETHAEAKTIAANNEYDIVIYGGTSAAVIAGVQATKDGRSVVIVSPDKHLGGLSAGGLGWTDSGNKTVIGGLSRNFYQRIKQKYDDPETWKFQKKEQYKRFKPADDAFWVFEPHIAEEVFEDLVTEYKLNVVREAKLDLKKGVTTKDQKIVSIRTDKGEYQGKIFIDATYEGDLMALAGVTYTVGRESNAKYGETLNGVQTKNARKHQFDYPVDPYVVQGDPKSGLLPGIHGDGPGVEGGADHRVQAYCFRMCLSNDARNRVPFPKPEGYDPQRYELMARYLDKGWKGVFNKFDVIPNHKTDTNNHGGFSFDNIGMNYEYPEGDYETRAKIIEEHTTYQQGLLWFLANDPRVPADIQKRINTWGLAKDEFLDNGHWPHQIYVREARRMVSDFVMSEQHLTLMKPTVDSIGMGSYNMDSHNVQRYVDKNGHARNEGDVQISPGGPYPISYRAIIPKKSECTNLLVPVCLSSSHIAYGSIRMEPVFMILGESASTAAHIALTKNITVQDVKYEDLKPRLLSQGQVLNYKRKPKGAMAKGIDPSTLAGIVIDNADAKLTGPWKKSGATGTYIGTEYLHDDAGADRKCEATFTTTVKTSGAHIILVCYTPNGNRASNVPVTLKYGKQTKSFKVNQKKEPDIKPASYSLGEITLKKNDTVTVTITNEGANGHVIVDAVRIVQVLE